MKAVTVSRTFDPRIWAIPLSCVGADIHAGGRSITAEGRRRAVAFYLDPTGEPVCQSLCPPTLWFPTLVGRVAAATVEVPRTEGHAAGVRATLRINAALPLATALADVAFPGADLAGAQLADITVVDAAGHRRTVHAELPLAITTSSPIMLALRAVSASTPAHRETTTRSAPAAPAG